MSMRKYSGSPVSEKVVHRLALALDAPFSLSDAKGRL